MTARYSYSEIFIKSLPVAVGYLFLGFTFGVLLEQKGGSVEMSFLVALTSFAGSAQFLGLSFLNTNFNPFILLGALLVLNLRHVLYAMSCIHDLGRPGIYRTYLLFSLTDENFAIFQDYKSENKNLGRELSQKLLLKVFGLNHLYWILSCTLGAIVGGYFNIELVGFDFALTAFFIVVFVERMKTSIGFMPNILSSSLIRRASK